MANLNSGKSVGALIMREGKTLALYRKVFPLGLALPAGHIDEGEMPEEALVREVLEETGLRVVHHELLLEKTFPNPCSKGHPEHHWFVYLVTADGEPRVCEPDKHEWVKFLAPEEIAGFLSHNDADPAWEEFIFPALELFQSS